MSQSFTLKRRIAWNIVKIVSDTLNHLHQFVLLASRDQAQTETRKSYVYWTVHHLDS